MSVLERIVSLYAPHSCLGCDLEGSILCDGCASDLTRPASCCYRCLDSSHLGRTCVDCRLSTPIVSLNCATGYRSTAKDLLWALKFDRAQAAAFVIAKVMAETFGDVVPEDALIVPVPTAMERVRKRGYDQATLIARAFAHQTGCRYATPLRRQGNKEQKGANRQERHQQLEGAFVVPRPKRVAAQRIILIDDVVTTGASVEAAAATLKLAGAKTVAALAFARA